ncbi:hypothetical protein [Ornithinibacillus sp. 179-J 7C1 HS]|uniref:hypothetical protein n=1 Tax=Ornithinibacillus sp. 179-J 7C1 HS TaxID=3142384 RepID=UPI0039A374FA
MNLKAFWVSFVIAFLLMSLPSLFGIGYVIDWTPEATLFQKFTGYVAEVFFNNFPIKLILASLVGIIVSFVIARKRRTMEE